MSHDAREWTNWSQRQTQDAKLYHDQHVDDAPEYQPQHLR